MNIPDNSKYEQMIRNRPAVSQLPAINKRLVSQYFGRTFFYASSFFLIGTLFLYKFCLNANASPFLKTKKTFTFNADPYTGKVSCNYRDVPNFQHGY